MRRCSKDINQERIVRSGREINRGHKWGTAPAHTGGCDVRGAAVTFWHPWRCYHNNALAIICTAIWICRCVFGGESCKKQRTGDAADHLSPCLDLHES